jgi:pimeloyl-ACP methyl ester carboxylesterase
MYTIERKGSSPPVVCVHGYCQSSTFWEPTLDRLARSGVHGLAVDLPGFAASAAEPGPYTMEGLADALAAFLDHRRLDRIVLVGGSMGGVVAQHFVLRHPSRVSRLLLVATGPYTADPAGALAKAAVMEAGPWDEATVTPIVNGFFYQPPPAPELARLRQVALMASKTAAVEAARSNATSRTLERLGEIRIPTLIIQGRHDRARTPEHGAEMRDRIAGSRLEIIEGAGHTPHLEQPDKFHQIAVPFLLADR